MLKISQKSWSSCAAILAVSWVQKGKGYICTWTDDGLINAKSLSSASFRIKWLHCTAFPQPHQLFSKRLLYTTLHWDQISSLHPLGYQIGIYKSTAMLSGCNMLHLDFFTRHSILIPVLLIWQNILFSFGNLKLWLQIFTSLMLYGLLSGLTKILEKNINQIWTTTWYWYVPQPQSSHGWWCYSSLVWVTALLQKTFWRHQNSTGVGLAVITAHLLPSILQREV